MENPKGKLRKTISFRGELPEKYAQGDFDTYVEDETGGDPKNNHLEDFKRPYELTIKSSVENKESKTHPSCLRCKAPTSWLDKYKICICNKELHYCRLCIESVCAIYCPYCPLETSMVRCCSKECEDSAIKIFQQQRLEKNCQYCYNIIYCKHRAVNGTHTDYICSRCEEPAIIQSFNFICKDCFDDGFTTGIKSYCEKHTPLE